MGEPGTAHCFNCDSGRMGELRTVHCFNCGCEPVDWKEENRIMKKMKLRSITARITIWFTIILLLTVTLTFLIFRFVSASILQKTLRGYLIGSVDENIDKIRFLTEENHSAADKDNIVIRFQEGWLEIDDDYLDVIDDVQSALYTGDGNLLYGKNPIAREMEGEDFSDSRIYLYRSAAGECFYVYDRELKKDELTGLWIRGVVPLSSEEMQLADIFRSAMVFVPFLILLGACGSWLTVRSGLFPIRRIEQTASEITRGQDLARRISIGEVDAEMQDLTTAFNDMLDRLEHAFEAEQQFTSDASHELRTPLSVILAQTELALDRERSPEEYRRALGVIFRQGTRMNTLVSSMLDYSRLEMRPENYPLTPMNLSNTVRGCAEDAAFLHPQKRIRIQTEIEEDIMISGNLLLVERAVQNVLENAYKYGKTDGQITVTLRREGDSRAVCAVADDGIGISAEDQGRIFDRFYRADTSRSSQQGISGAGLGLSMVRRIMDIHNGQVSVSSTPGKGSIFFLHFPVL